MKIDLNVIITGLKGEKIEGGAIVAADQLANIAMTDRGESAKDARTAYKLNGLMEKIALAKKEVDLSQEEIDLLITLLDNAMKAKRVSTFLVGRLYGLLNAGKEKDELEGSK